MLTIAGGILLAGVLLVCGGVILGFLGLPFTFARLFWQGKHKKPLPVRHYCEELPDHLGGSDFD